MNTSHIPSASRKVGRAVAIRIYLFLRAVILPPLCCTTCWKNYQVWFLELLHIVKESKKSLVNTGWGEGSVLGGSGVDIFFLLLPGGETWSNFFLSPDGNEKRHKENGVIYFHFVLYPVLLKKEKKKGLKICVEKTGLLGGALVSPSPPVPALDSVVAQWILVEWMTDFLAWWYVRFPESPLKHWS